MDLQMFMEIVASNGLSTGALIVVALYFKKINEENRDDNKQRELENRDREDTLIMKIQTVNETNKDLACMGVELTKTNTEIAKTNSLLAQDMKIGLTKIDDKLDKLIYKKEE